MTVTGTPHLITAPTAAVLSADDARTMLGLSATAPSDELLEAMIGAVVGTLDAGTGWLGRALCPQTWEYRFDDFPSDGCAIRLPYPPLTELTSVIYVDSAGDDVTLVEDTDYRVIGLGGHNRASVETVYDGSWPTSRGDTGSVRIRYACGYAPAAMPPAIKAAIALGVKHLQSTSERNLFMQREDIPGVRSRQWVVSEAAGKAIEHAIGSLLSTYRVFG